MADIELVIKLDEEVYKYAKRYSVSSMLALREMDMCMNAILNGTPLPKGHGRLIDVDAIVYEKECVYLSDGGCTTESTPNISATPTIIEADKEQEHGAY